MNSLRCSASTLRVPRERTPLASQICLVIYSSILPRILGSFPRVKINGCDLCNIGQDLFNSLQKSPPLLPILPLALGDEKIGHRQAVGGINHFFRQLLGKIFSVPFNHKAF